MANRIYVVAVYDRWREYGGPEEGGWWYTQGELVDVDTAWQNEDVAWERASDMNHDFELTSQPTGYGTWRRATVVELGRREHIYADQLCHMDPDEAEDESMYRTRWDIPEYENEGRPHYC